MRQYSRQNSSNSKRVTVHPSSIHADGSGQLVAEKQGSLQKSGKGTRDSIKTTMHKRDTIKATNISSFQSVQNNINDPVS